MKYWIFTGGDRNQLFHQLMGDLVALQEEQRVTCISSLPSVPPYLQKLYELHHKPSLNKKRSLPFRSIWNSYMPLKEAQLRQGAHCLIINNVSAPYMEPGLLRAWKKKYDVKLVMYFLDVWDSYYARGARNLLKQVPFDQVYTFYQKDAKEHGLRYFDTYYSALPAPEKKEAGVDVFFWGTDGGRRPLIEGVANRVAELGFSGEYGICYTESSEQQMSTNPRAKFIYNEPLPYEEVIQKLMQARIILDVVGDYSGGVSLRYFESFAYGKKLISNNPLVKEMRGYQENRILYIEKPEDITEEFLREEIALTYHQEFSPVHWIEELDRS